MYKRVLLKLSGEALAGKDSTFNSDVLHDLAKEIREVQSKGVEVAVVVGGGNIIRGKMAVELGMDRTQGDHMGMLATIINALAIQAALEAEGVDTRVQTAINMPEVAEPFIERRAVRHLEKGRVVIFGGGTGLPFFSTDTAAALRASEIKADAILMAKNGVDGVYSADPKKDPDAKRFDTLTYMDLLEKNLQVMDSTATSLCMDNNMTIMVFNMNEKGNIVRACMGEKTGTIIKKGEYSMSYPIIDTSTKKMDKVLEHLHDELNTIRTGMANAKMLDRVEVDYYGSPTPLNQIAGISVQEGRTLVVKPYDPSSLKDIEKAINKADIGIAPANDGTVIRLTVPELTGETRKEMTKKVSKIAEECKVQIRNIRREANDVVKKDKTLDEDSQKDAKEEVQKLTDSYIKKIEEAADKKSREVLKV